MNPTHYGQMLALMVLATVFTGCKAFMHGYTEDKAQNAYYLVTGNEDNFGDRRIRYNKAFHRHSQLSSFLECKGHPAFIYEYKTAARCRGIRLFYPTIDSVFVFEEPRKGNLRSVVKEQRNMDEHERLTFAKLTSYKQ